jgi:hypothetical protein
MPDVGVELNVNIVQVNNIFLTFVFTDKDFILVS